VDLLGPVRPRFELVDTAGTSRGISGRDQRAVLKSVSGLLKLLYPNGRIGAEELEEVLALGCELRQRVREQLHLIAPGEYDRVALGVKMLPSGKQITVTLPEAGRVQKVTLPAAATVGEVTGLAVAGDHGCILLFEMQATKGSGRIVPLGSIQRVMRESIQAATQYIKANPLKLGIPADWSENYDVAVLATFMSLPKEGPSAGITIVTGIVSALTERPVRSDIAMTGEITIKGKVLPVGGVMEKVRAAYAAGVREVLLPMDNLAEARLLPQYILDAVRITPVQSIDEVLAAALLDPPDPP
jgi:ATP-dependent Lon protease